MHATNAIRVYAGIMVHGSLKKAEQLSKSH